jgi:hypothetical protein
MFMPRELVAHDGHSKWPAAESERIASLELARTTYAARVTRPWRVGHEFILLARRKLSRRWSF